MRQTELILFIVVMLINGGIALYKKHKQREAERAAKSLENLATGARAEATGVRPPRATAPMRAKPAVARAAPAPAPAPALARAVAPSAGPTPERAKSMAQVVEELERRVRERLSAGAPPSERAVPPTPVPPAPVAPAPAAVPAIARAAAIRPGAGIGAVNVARTRPALGTRRALRDAVIASEVLGRPRADRPFGA